MKRAIVISVILFSLCSAVYPAIVLRYIDIKGNDSFSDREIIRWSGLSSGMTVRNMDFHAAFMKILAGFARDGRFFASIDSVKMQFNDDSTTFTMEIYLSEGPKVHLDEVSVTDSSRAELAGMSELFRRRSTFFPEHLEAGIEEVLILTEEEGFPFCMLSIQGMHSMHDLETAPLYIEMLLERGPQVMLAGVEIAGNKSTRGKFIVRESRLKSGELFSAESLRRARRYLLNTGLFSKVKQPELIRRGNDYYAKIVVIEGRHNSMDAVLGYAPRTNTRAGYFTGMLDFAFNNLFGTGRRFKFHWEQPERKSQDISLSYREPWIAGLPVDAGFQFSQSVKSASSLAGGEGDDRFLTRKITIEGFYRLNESFEFNGGVLFSETAPDSLSRYAGGIPKSGSTGLQGGFTIDTRDNNLNPRSGLYYKNTAAWLNKKNDIDSLSALPSKAEEHRIEADFETALPLTRWHVFDVRASGRYLDSEQADIPISEMYYLGGVKSLRGYRDEQFFGTTVSWTNLEYRLIIGKNSRLFLFNDWGYYYRKSKQADGTQAAVEGFKYGYGAGIRLETAVGIIGIDYGLGQGDAPLEGKLHVRLRNEF
ncbi:BamA/TamA family outer membrane protein [bacterium]|nr:BamA/TamA family outer membrane protein [FCB group bacterium]MBL7191910.1 BamA/TamA family outer membrane protein [bacterium]